MFTKEKLIATRAFLSSKVHETPVLTSSYLNNLSGAELFFKCENFQKVGAFKFRGASWAIHNLSKEQLSKGVTTHSSGNHGQAVAKAAQSAGVRAYIVMPENAPSVKINAVKSYGAEVTLCPPTLESRELYMNRIVEEKGATLIHPYNDPHIIEGQSTCAQELIEQVEELDQIITPVGGGGLLSGTILATQFFAPHIQVSAGEPYGADDAYRSIKTGKLVTELTPDSVADGLRTLLGIHTFPIIAQGVTSIIRVTDEEIIDSMRLIWERMKIIVEPSCTVTLAAILNSPDVFKNKRVGVVLTGGNVDLVKTLALFK